MRKITAPYILNPEGELLEGYTLISDQGQIIDLVKGEKSDAMFVEGILCPGFINAHCHLELSYLKEKIHRGNKLSGFIKELVEIRKTAAQGDEQSMAEADKKMWENGIQAVGDICNNNSSFKTKSKSRITYHSFVELFSMFPEMADEIFNSGNHLYEEALASHRHASIVPHSPYSVPGQLFSKIKNFSNENKGIWCIHNQETASENDMFLDGSGELVAAFIEMGVNRSWFSPTRLRSIESIGKFIPKDVSIQLVHNTFTTQDDINFLDSEKLLKRTWFCFCPKANLFIENMLPDVNLFVKNKCNITLGTDSLASNDSLSILEEIKTIHRAFPEIPIASLLTWATANGSRYFGWDQLGVFRKGAEPGILQITECGPDFLSDSSVVNRIV